MIAREDKGEVYGIDYKYSDMITSYGLETNNIQPETTFNPSQPIQPTQQSRATSSTQVSRQISILLKASPISNDFISDI